MATSTVILARSYLPNNASLTLWSRSLLFAVLALVGYLIPNVYDSPALQVLYPARSQGTIVAKAVFAVALGALCASVLAVFPRRFRRDLYGYLHPIRSPREEIVCELVQAADLLIRMPSDGAGNSDRKRVVEEKVDRVRHLFRERLILKRRGDWEGCRDGARQLKALRNRVRRDGSGTWSNDADILLMAAVGVFLDNDKMLREDFSYERRIVQQQRLAAVALPAAALVLLWLWVASRFFALSALRLESLSRLWPSRPSSWSRRFIYSRRHSGKAESGG